MKEWTKHKQRVNRPARYAFRGFDAARPNPQPTGAFRDALLLPVRAVMRPEAHAQRALAATRHCRLAA